jgi:hypothetical protein
MGQSNMFAQNQVKLLQANNLSANNTDLCDYLMDAVSAWLKGSTTEQIDYTIESSTQTDVFVLWAQLLPVRCPWQREDGVITWCDPSLYDQYAACSFWNETKPPLPDLATPEYFADVLGERVGGILSIVISTVAYADFYSLESNQTYQVRVIVDENDTLAFSYVP